MTRPAWLGSAGALWTVFGLVHGGLLVLGVWIVPERAFWDLSLYRWWVGQGLAGGGWPVLDDAWVYPAGALVPMLLAALGGTGGGTGFAIAWTLLVTAANGGAVVLLLRDPARRRVLATTGPHDHRRWHPSPAGAWWWVAFVAALGPVAVGRLDAVVAPLTVVALALAVRRPEVAAALLTAGAWVKVTPGALLLPLVLAVRRPLRRVVAPAAVVCAAVLGVVAVLGGLPRVATFVSAQDGRGLQLEAVVSTPWVLLGLVGAGVGRSYDEVLVTWEVAGPGTAGTAAAMDGVLVVGVALAALLLLLARRRAGAAFADPRVRLAFVVRGALLLGVLLIVTNKVGSPQYVGWLAAPVVVALTVGLPGWGRTAAVLLGTALATQLVFPWLYTPITQGEPLPTLLLVARNLALLGLTAQTARRLLTDARAAAEEPAAAATGGGDVTARA